MSVRDGYKHGRVTMPGNATSNNECQRLLFHCNARDIFAQIIPFYIHAPEPKFKIENRIK